MKVLISGFDPFGKESINPSIEAVKLLPDQIGDIEIIKVMLPTIAYACVDSMLAHIEAHKPDVVINVGQAGGYAKIALERVAININDFSICDNKGQMFCDEAIYEDGENAYFSTLPLRQMKTQLEKANIAATISNSAGTFVCNHLMYAMRYWQIKQKLHYRSGFVHIPFLPVQAKHTQLPSMPLTTVVEALKIIVCACCEEGCQDA